jgi:tol-pal system protein YbgF
MRRFHRSSGVLGLAALLGVAGLTGCASGPDPMEVKVDDMDQRLGRIERVVNNQSLVSLSQRIDALEAQLRSLRGDSEVMQNGNDTLRKQQRDLYADLDKRIAALETALKNGTAGQPGGAPGAGGGADSNQVSGGAAGSPAQTDQAAYAAAFDRLKASDYPGAIRQFQDFLRNYPNSTLADNAEYWLGKSYYVNHDYDNATMALKAVGERWPQSRKVPDAMLDLGLMQVEQKRLADARATLGQLVQRYPGTDAAKIASDRLQKLPP